jgi:hypothetical protein
MMVVLYLSKEKMTGVFSASVDLAALVTLGLLTYAILVLLIQKRQMQALLGALTAMLPGPLLGKW